MPGKDIDGVSPHIQTFSMLNPQEGEIYCFNKPYTMTSFRLVSKVRGILCHKLGIKKLKVGHAGTLDPLATGVLIVCTGKATKQIDEIQAGTKEYVATLKLGATTPSFDRETAEDATYPTGHITRELVEQTFSRFIGEIDQVPPTFSAVKIDGKPAYKSARKGAEVEIKSKKLVIDAIELLSYDLDDKVPTPLQPIHIKHADVEQLAAEDNSSPQPTITIRVVCSKGTYIRALARDIGEALGSGAYLTALIRTKVGNYSLQNARDITTFEQWVENSKPTNLNHD